MYVPAVRSKSIYTKVFGIIKEKKEIKEEEEKKPPICVYFSGVAAALLQILLH